MITIELPSEIEHQLQTEWQDLARHALEGLVTEAFRQGKLSSYQIGQALGMSDRWQVIEFLSKRGAYPGYDEEAFDQDMAAIEKLRAK